MKMKKTILLIGMTIAPLAPVFGQGFLNHLGVLDEVVFDDGADGRLLLV